MFKEFIENNKGKTVKITTFGYFLFCSDFAKELGLNPDLPNKLHQFKNTNELSLKEPTEQNKENLSENYLKNIVLISGVLLAYSAAAVGAIMLNQKSKHKK